MNLKKILGMSLSTVALAVSFLGDVNAASVDVKCEVRSNRSKISVDGAGLPNALYRASVKSGTTTVLSKPAATQRPAAGEVEFDFDSNPVDVANGATAIPATFIKNLTAIGTIYRVASTGLVAVATATETCRKK